MRRFFILFFALTATGFLAHAENVRFGRPLKAGDCFDCIVQTSQSRRTSLLMPGMEDSAVRLHTVKAVLSGKLTVEKVTASGRAQAIRFETASLSGAVDGRAVDAASLAGKTFTANLEKAPVRFEAGQEMLAPEVRILLASIFQPVSKYGFADLTGKERVLEKSGTIWQAGLTAFRSALMERGVSLAPSAAAGNILFAGTEDFRGLPCHVFRFQIQTKNSAGYDFRFSASVLLPVDPEAGPPVRITREGTEVVDRILPASNPFAAGAKMQLISKDSTDIMLFPVRFLKEEPAKKESFWDALLR